jgi:hypothetical protein
VSSASSPPIFRTTRRFTFTTLETNVASIVTQSYVSNITHHQFFGVLLAPRTSQTNKHTNLNMDITLKIEAPEIIAALHGIADAIRNAPPPEVVLPLPPPHQFTPKPSVDTTAPVIPAPKRGRPPKEAAPAEVAAAAAEKLPDYDTLLSDGRRIVNEGLVADQEAGNRHYRDLARDTILEVDPDSEGKIRLVKPELLAAAVEALKGVMPK